MSDSPRAADDQGSSVHRPVLVREVVQFLDLRPGLVVVDGTVGAGGHARVVLSHMGPDDKLIGLDRDPMMIAWASQSLDDPRCVLRHANYVEMPRILDELRIDKVDRVLLDLGLSSDQLADAGRGFGFQAGGPLDMRFDTSRGQPASELLATLPEAELADIFFKFGEERFSRNIARTIVRRRPTRPVRTTDDLVDAVAESWRGGTHRHETHPATRVFQALRIAVNHELQHLQDFLSTALPERLRDGGRAVIITFHSLEDRLVKNAFRDHETWQNLTSKPVTARTAEQRINPRCRTAKLRAAVRIRAKTETGESPANPIPRPT